MKISAAQYSMMYGPTVGDKVRLADTNLIIEDVYKRQVLPTRFLSPC